MAKIKYRRPTPSDYTTRAARAEAKKVLLAILADAIRDSAICGYDGATIDVANFSERISHWPNLRWQGGALSELDRAAMELLDEFRRRADR